MKKKLYLKATSQDEWNKIHFDYKIIYKKTSKNYEILSNGS